MSAAVHWRLALAPIARPSPPFGARTVTLGAAVSAKAAVTAWLASIVRLRGLARPDASPLQPVKANPVAGRAVSWTVLPAA